VRIHLARRIDGILGPFVCLILRILSFLSLKSKNNILGLKNNADVYKPMTQDTLIIKFFGFGSIIHMEKMIQAVKQASPNSRVILLTFTNNKSIAKLLTGIDDVESISFSQGFFRFIIETISCIYRLRKQNFGVIINCEFYSYYAAIMAYIISQSSSCILGFFCNKPLREWIYSRRVALDHTQHISDQFTKLIQPLNLPTKSLKLHKPQLNIPENAIKKIDSMLGNIVIPDNAFLVAVNINASELDHNRRWPISSFKSLINLLLNDEEKRKIMRFVLIGGEDDKSYVNSLAQDLDSDYVYDFSGIISLPELTALLVRCDIFLGNDSGPLHLAVNCNISTISIFGPETPAMYGPVGSKHTVFYTNRFCSPCLNVYFSKESKCSNNLCVKEIDPHAVYSAFCNKFIHIASERKLLAG